MGIKNDFYRFCKTILPLQYRDGRLEVWTGMDVRAETLMRKSL